MSGGLYGKEGDSPFLYLWDEDERPASASRPPPIWTYPRYCAEERCVATNRYHFGPCTWRPLERYL